MNGSRQPTATKLFANSFSALAGTTVHTLILGSMPGQASLQAQQYYAHPRNAFWPIMVALIRCTEPDRVTTLKRPYAMRCQELTDHGFALWDVLAQCQRPGSLDADIIRDTEVANDIAGFIQQHPALDTIAFNGQAAKKLFARHVVMGKQQSPPRFLLLPSSSPALASLSLQEKFRLWKVLQRSP